MKKYLTIILFLFISGVSRAQNGAWQIPRVVYVGDPATLILPLAGSAEDSADIILTAQSSNNAVNFPSSLNIDFHRIVLERRTSASRLLIEFTAFAPGTLELPVIEIGGMSFSGLTVTINSVIDSKNSTLELSRPASSLAMPGTALMLYGTLAGFALLLLSAIWFALKGRRYLQRWTEKWKLRRLFISIRNTEKRLNKNLSKGGSKRDILNKLSFEFKNFLSVYTGNNCRAMTSREFENLSLNSSFLVNFFKRCDFYRFSGADFEAGDISRLLADMLLFLDELEKSKTENENPGEEKAA